MPNNYTPSLEKLFSGCLLLDSTWKGCGQSACIPFYQEAIWRPFCWLVKHGDGSFQSGSEAELTLDGVLEVFICTTVQDVYFRFLRFWQFLDFFGVGMHFYHHTWLRWLCCRLTTTKNEDFLLFLDFLSFFGAGMHFYLHAWLRWFAVGCLRNISENGGQLGSQSTAKSP